MRTRRAMSLAALTILGLGSWIMPAAAAQSRAGGSEVPCAVPLSWRVARVDDEFGIEVPEAERAIQQAAALWEEATGRQLFVMDATDGFPVRFVYDERQARTQERIRREAEFEEEGRRLESRGEELTEQAERLRQAQARHAERLRAYESRVLAHNTLVRGWNDRGGAPAGVERELSAAGESLALERRELEAESRAREDELLALQDEQARLNRQVGEHNRQADALARAFPPTPTEAGVYREAVRREGERVLSVGREIRIYRFGSVDELRLVAAHELGHALGLGHSPEAAAVMSAEHGEGGGSGGLVGIHPADLTLLRATCPELGAPG